MRWRDRERARAGLRVLAMTNLFPNPQEPNRGVFNLQQFEALTRECDLQVIAPVAWRPWARSAHPPIPFHARWNGLPVSYPRYFFTPRIGRVAYALWMYCSIRGTVMRVAREYRPDVLLVTWAYPDAVAGAALARRLELPWVAKVHGSDVNVSAMVPALRRQIRWALRQASCTFAVSEPLKQRLIEIGVPARAIRVQHNGIDPDRFAVMDRVEARRKLGLPLDRQITLYVGNLKPDKGVLDLLEAARSMAADGGEMPLVVYVGGGSGHEPLAAGIARHGLGEAVRLAGPRPHDEIPAWIAAADLLCLPSHREGCPNVVLEALACGRPVVASRVGAVPEFVDDRSGFVVEPGEPSELARALRLAVARPWDPMTLRSRVLPLSWETNARAMACELEKAARGASRATLPEIEAPAALAEPAGRGEAR